MYKRQPYGFRRYPFTGKKIFHGGLDLHARGEKVMAMMAGILVKVGHDNASGKYVVLRHGNYQVSYCHLSRILVEMCIRDRYRWVQAFSDKAYPFTVFR